MATGLNVSLTVGGDIGVDANAQWPYAADGMGADYLAFAAEGNLSANGAFRVTARLLPRVMRLDA